MKLFYFILFFQEIQMCFNGIILLYSLKILLSFSIYFAILRKIFVDFISFPKTAFVCKIIAYFYNIMHKYTAIKI